MSFLEKIVFWLILMIICSTIGTPDFCYNACFVMIVYNIRNYFNDIQ